MPLQAGTRFGPYEVVALIGSGGMGEVWLATELRLGRRVALKLLPADVTRAGDRIQRFEQEARAASALNHPNVCTIYALGEAGEGQHYIAMEYVEGQTLRRRLGTSRLSAREALDTAIQVAAALSVAHAAGIVHRDIKPENIMLRPDGFVKVLDFGLAKLVAADSDPTMATRTVLRTDAGTAVGTVSYMSPEQARGQQVDARTDIWALGVVLYEMIASRRPFAGQSTSDVLAAILEHDPAPLARFDPEASPEQQRIVTKALRKDPEQRYQVMKDLLLDLQALRDELASSATAQRAATVGIDTRRRLVGGVTVVIIVLVLGAALWWMRRPPIAQSTVPQPTVNRSLTRLTFDPGLQIGATFSPDGRSIAYASDRAGNFDIWIQSVAGGDARQLTTSPFQETEPAWAPDGQTIVFRSEQNGGGLFSVPVTGGSERQLTNFGAHPIWVPGRAEILFRSGVTSGVEYGFGLYAVSSDGTGSPRELLHDFLAGGVWPWIAPHPDGRISVYGVHSTRREGFFTISRDGRTVTESKQGKEFPLQVSEAGTRLVRFQWNGDGTGLYVEAFLKEVRNLWKVKVNPATLDWISAERLTTGMGADVGLSLSRDGRSIAFTTRRESTRLWTYPFDSVTSRMRGVGRPVTAEDGRVSNMALSSDGRWLAYNLTLAGSATLTGALWARDLETGNSVMLSENASFPAWSRNSRQIAYTLFKGPDSSGRLTTALATRDIEGPERLIAKWSEEFILVPWDWVSSGQDLVGSYSSPPTGIAKLVLWPTQSGAESNPRRVLVEAPGRNFWQARFSPNNRWVAFSTAEQEPDRCQIYVTRAGGAQAADWVRVAAEHAWADKPRWAPDGRMLYFLSRHGSEFLNLWGTRFDPENGRPAGTPFAITHFDSPGLMISPDVSDEEWGVAARRAVLTMVSATGNIWMIENVDR